MSLYTIVSLYEKCKAVIGKRVRYRGTNGNEYSSNHGKPLEGEGKCLSVHGSHGLCIMILTDDNKELCVDPVEVRECEG
jgi:hypothetical protein